MASTIAFGVILIALSSALLVMHWRAWEAARASADTFQRGFAQTQWWRRTQASGLIGIVGVAIAAFALVPRRPAWMIAYLVLLGVALAWMIWLALVDIWATRLHYQQLEQRHWEAEAQIARDVSAAPPEEQE